MQGTTTGVGWGKAILFGEHAVVHGVPAIAVGLPRGVFAVARPAERDELRVAPWNRALHPDPRSQDRLSCAFAETLASYRDRPRLRVEARVDLPPGAGLGCSAALGVAILDAVDKALGIDRTRAELGEKALQWERFFHGAPSGVDNAAAALGGLVRFDRQRGARGLSNPTSLHLVIANSGERSETKQMVARVSDQLERQPCRTRRLFEEVRALVGRAEDSILEGDVDTLADCLDGNHDVLRRLDLSTRGVESLRDRAMRAGALGAKVTGAGGGGCIVALAENAGHARFIVDAVRNDAFATEIPRAA